MTILQQFASEIKASLEKSAVGYENSNNEYENRYNDLVDSISDVLEDFCIGRSGNING